LMGLSVHQGSAPGVPMMTRRTLHSSFGAIGPEEGARVYRTIGTRPRPLPRLAALVTAASLTLLLAPSPTVDAASSAENKMRQLINGERTERGKKALAMNEVLVGIARRHSKEMAEDGKIYHNPHLSSAVRFTNPSAWGENVGMGVSVPRLHDLFMASPPHRKNILKPDFDRIGVGLVQEDGVLYVTVVFVAVGPSKLARIVTVGTPSVASLEPDVSAPIVSPPSGAAASVAPDPDGVEEQPEPDPGVLEDAETLVDEVLEQAPIGEEVPQPVP